MTQTQLQTPPQGNFFEDYFIGRHFRHPTPRTVTQGDSSLHIAFTGARQPLHCNAPLSVAIGYPDMPVDDILVFNIAFGKTVADISANAIANLGYADIRFLKPVYAGDTIRAESDVIGLRPTSKGDAGVVYVRSTAFNQHNQPVLTWIRWVLVRKADQDAPNPEVIVPDLPAMVDAQDLIVPALSLDNQAITDATGSSKFWDDYSAGERIDHPAGMTLDESDHTLATKLYQNTAKVHFDALAMKQTPHGRRLIYGGHVISVCRALSYDGLENVLGILAINGGSHNAPTFGGDTLYCFTEVKEKIALPGRSDVGAMRLRLVGITNTPAAGFSASITVDGKTRANPAVVLDLDYTVLLPKAYLQRRSAFKKMKSRSTIADPS